jgi:hypothetical protein
MMLSAVEMSMRVQTTTYRRLLHKQAWIDPELLTREEHGRRLRDSCEGTRVHGQACGLVVSHVLLVEQFALALAMSEPIVRAIRS